MILVDPRKGGRKDLPDLTDLPPLDSSDVAIHSTLSSADVMFSGVGPGDSSRLTGIEMKRVDDLINSRQTGRLQDTQIPAMLREYDECWLLTYGRYRCDPSDHCTLQVEKQWGGKPPVWCRVQAQGTRKTKKTKTGNGNGGNGNGPRYLPYSYVESFIVSLGDLGIRHHHCDSLQQCAEWVYFLYCKRQQSWSRQHRNLRAFDVSAPAPTTARASLRDSLHELGEHHALDEKAQLCAKMLKEVPGIGYEKSILAAKHFRTARAAINATKEEWQNVDGIGKVIAGEADRVLG